MRRSHALVRASNSPSQQAQFLTFTLGEETYGIDVLSVQEIRSCSALTPVASPLPYVKGLLNLRGDLTPILCLRSRFGMVRLPYTPFTVIIIVRTSMRLVGMLVDAVSDVVTVPLADIQPPPECNGPAERQFIDGMAMVSEKLVVLVNVDRLLGRDEFAAIQHASQDVRLSGVAPAQLEYSQ
jgi:purine-binding chemotaxis protein CheW